MIYAVQPTTGGPVKIGHSDDVARRLAQLEAHYRQPLAVLATFEGGREEEQAIHAQFAHLRFGRTEQFRPAAELMAFLGRPLLVDANPAIVEAIAVATSMARVTKEANEGARSVCGFYGETISGYIDRVVKERVEADRAKIARQFVAEEEKKKGKGGEADA